MGWVIAIPSYNRVDTLKAKTLAVLKEYGIPKSKIHVFVANSEEEQLYKAGVGGDVGHIIVGIKGLAEVRNFIFEYFPKGQQIVFMDDDVRGLIEYDAGAKRHERKLPLDRLEGVFERGFDECKSVGAQLWGVYPSANGFFMKPTVTTDLRFIIGSFWGCINPGGDPKYLLKFGGEKEDYQRTIQFWEADGAVVRLNFISVKTAYYKEPGGMQDGTRLGKQRKTVKLMLKRWPHYIRLNPRRKTGYPEILLAKPKQEQKPKGGTRKIKK